MTDIFQPYQPNSSQHRPSLRACEACYARKVRCDLNEDGSKCRQCAVHGVECRPRSRKRKASALRDDEQFAGQTVDDTSPPSQQGTAETSFRRSGGVRDYRGGEIRTPLLFVRRESNNAVSPENANPFSSSRLRTSSFLSRAAILGEDFPGIDHSHGTRIDSEGGLSMQEVEALSLQGAFEIPDLPLRQSLYEAFMQYCWPWMPVIELADFDVAVMGDGSSLVVLQAVMLAGAIMRPEICSKVTVKQYYQRLKALIQSGYEQNPLNTLSALCLIQWYTPAAPKDVSTDSPRFWNTYAIGLAHQLGLHRLSKQANDTSIRRRIYFTLCARDCLTSAAHGRPKLLHPADCDLPPVALDDFSASDEDPARLFIAYSEVTSILGDLCQIVTRNGRITNHEHVAIVRRLQELLHGLPPHLSLLGATGSAKSYKLNTSQLHVAILTALVVLYRPRSVFTLSESASPSITAAFLIFRLFQAIQLRADTKYLGSAFAWYLLVAAIPLLSSAGVPGIANEATFALDGLESSLATLGEVRPAAANNFKSVRAIRHAVANATRPSRAGTDTRTRAADEAGMASIFAHYGQEASQLLKDMTSILHSSSDRQDYIASDTTQPQQAVESVMTAAMEPRSQPSVSNGFESQSTSGSDGLHNAISALFNDETLIDANSWMLRDWMDLMPPTVEE